MRQSNARHSLAFIHKDILLRPRQSRSSTADQDTFRVIYPKAPDPFADPGLNFTAHTSFQNGQRNSRQGTEACAMTNRSLNTNSTWPISNLLPGPKIVDCNVPVSACASRATTFAKTRASIRDVAHALTFSRASWCCVITRESLVSKAKRVQVRMILAQHVTVSPSIAVKPRARS